jgi:hypothetical protein
MVEDVDEGLLLMEVNALVLETLGWMGGTRGGIGERPEMGRGKAGLIGS